MENVSEDRKKKKFSSKEMAVIEWKLVRAIDTLQENPNRNEIKGMIRNYFIQFCYDNNYSVKDTFEVVKPLIKRTVKIELKDIVPESKRGEEALITRTFAGILYKSGVIWNEEKTDLAIDRFSNITGIAKDIIIPHINFFIKQRKREVIETEVLEFLQTHVATIEDKGKRMKTGKLVIDEFADALELEPTYIKRVLRDKKKKDEAAKKIMPKSEIKNKQELPDNPDDNEAR